MSAKVYAIACHQEVNQTYDGFDYRLHIGIVAAQAKKWIDIIYPNIRYEVKQQVIDAGWCHDLIEDCRQTYNDVKNTTTELTADIVYAVTNEKGKTRAQRANKYYYTGIREQEYATFIKLCDRIGNLLYSFATNSNMYQKYKNEHEKFIEYCIAEDQREMFKPMTDFLNMLVNV